MGSGSSGRAAGKGKAAPGGGGGQAAEPARPSAGELAAAQYRKVQAQIADMQARLKAARARGDWYEATDLKGDIRFARSMLKRLPRP
jgi:hypothetical protein